MLQTKPESTTVHYHLLANAPGSAPRCAYRVEQDGFVVFTGTYGECEDYMLERASDNDTLSILEGRLNQNKLVRNYRAERRRQAELHGLICDLSGRLNVCRT